jgi:5-dehydro-2-deoxygluconokinase
MFPLFILPFDHRSGFAKELLHTAYPMDEVHAAKARELKKLIFEAFLMAEEEVETEGTLAILVDEELGQEIIEEAKANDIVHIVSTENSGKTFSFVHGERFGAALSALQPTFAKALVRYTLGEEEKNEDQRYKLKLLSDYCLEAEIPLMLEVLTETKEGEPKIAETLLELEEAGIMPAIWKLEGFKDRSSWQQVANVTEAPIVVLGRGQSTDEVELWIKEAAASGLVKGFAIGRTIFLKPLQDLLSGTITEEAAKRTIADNFLHFIKLWEANA